MQDSMDIREEMIRQADRDAAESLTEPTLDPLARSCAEALPDLLVALADLLGNGDLQWGISQSRCRWCGRDFYDLSLAEAKATKCPSDDCPGHMARAVLAKAEGATP